MVSFYGIKNHLTEKGYTYIPNQTIIVSRASNYVKIDDLGLFGLISKQEFDQLNK